MNKQIVPSKMAGATVAGQAGNSLVLATFLSGAGFTSIFSLLPIYMFHLSGPGAATALWAGFAMAVTPLAGAIVSPLWGRWGGRFGYRPMLLWALACTTVVTALMALPATPWQLVLLRALAGALGSFQPAALGAMTSWSQPEDLSKAVSRLQLGQIFGAIAGPLIGGVAATFFGIRAAPLAGALAVGLGALAIARWFHEPKSRKTPLRGAGQRLRPTILWLPILTLVAVQFTDASFNPILPLLLAQGESDPTAVAGLVSMAASLNATAAAAGSWLAGQGCKKVVSRRGAVAATTALGLAAFVALFAPLPYGLVALRISCGGLAAGMAVAAFSAGGLAVLPGQRASAYGWLSGSSMMGYAVSPIVAGGMAVIDLRAVLVLDAALCLIASAGWGWSLVPAPAPAAAKALVSTVEPAAQPRVPKGGNSEGASCRETTQ